MLVVIIKKEKKRRLLDHLRLVKGVKLQYLFNTVHVRCHHLSYLEYAALDQTKQKVNETNENKGLKTMSCPVVQFTSIQEPALVSETCSESTGAPNPTRRWTLIRRRTSSLVMSSGFPRSGCSRCLQWRALIWDLKKVELVEFGHQTLVIWKTDWNHNPCRTMWVCLPYPGMEQWWPSQWPDQRWA